MSCCDSAARDFAWLAEVLHSPRGRSRSRASARRERKLTHEGYDCTFLRRHRRVIGKNPAGLFRVIAGAPAGWSAEPGGAPADVCL